MSTSSFRNWPRSGAPPPGCTRGRTALTCRRVPRADRCRGRRTRSGRSTTSWTRRHRIPGIFETDPLPPIGLARSTRAPGGSVGSSSFFGPAANTVIAGTSPWVRNVACTRTMSARCSATSGRASTTGGSCTTTRSRRWGWVASRCRAAIAPELAPNTRAGSPCDSTSSMRNASPDDQFVPVQFAVRRPGEQFQCLAGRLRSALPRLDRGTVEKARSVSPTPGVPLVMLSSRLRARWPGFAVRGESTERPTPRCSATAVTGMLAGGRRAVLPLPDSHRVGYGSPTTRVARARPLGSVRQRRESRRQ